MGNYKICNILKMNGRREKRKKIGRGGGPVQEYKHKYGT